MINDDKFDSQVEPKLLDLSGKQVKRSILCEMTTGKETDNDATSTPGPVYEIFSLIHSQEAMRRRGAAGPCGLWPPLPRGPLSPSHLNVATS
jgi:hypothetical protein